MEDNNIHTSVVIELANPKGESEEKKQYQMDVDDSSAPKDYVIDQIYCGENVTVYALFEVSENECRNMDKNLLKLTKSNIEHDNKYYYKNSFKKITNEKKFNGYTQSVISTDQNMKFLADINNRNKSLYCLKHPLGNYELLAPESKPSDLKVLYSKNFSLEKSKSTKFKAISIGVNTDIVQSPKIIEEIQKVLGMNVPLIKFREKNTTASTFPGPYVTEVDTGPSLSSLSSSNESKILPGKSVSNVFFVPLLMMEDSPLNKLLKMEKSQKNLEKAKLPKTKDCVSKVSLGINTDESEFDSGVDLNKKKKQDTRDASESSDNSTQSPDFPPDDQNIELKLKRNERRTIIKEMKTMQLKLGALIKNIESSDFESDTQEYELTESDSKNGSEKSETSDKKEKFTGNAVQSFDRIKKNLDDHPIIPWTSSNDKIFISNQKNETDSENKEKNDKILNILDSVLNVADVTEMKKNNQSKKTVSYCKIIWKSTAISKSLPLSKSEINIHNSMKQNYLKKSLSLDFRNFRTEFFKNMKNYLSKQEGSLTVGVKERILQNNEVYSGDNKSFIKFDIDSNKKLNSKINKINYLSKNKKEEIPNVILTDFEVNKTYNEEEGDAKFDKPPKNGLSTIFDKVAEKPQPFYFDPNVTSSDGSLTPKKSLCSCRNDSKPPDKGVESEKKTCSDSEKPQTPVGNFRKIITTNSNMKKDSKAVKKTINRHKVIETTAKVELPFKRIGTGSKKLTNINGESKLHIDKLIKAGGLNNNNNISSYNKMPNSVKNNDEKLTPRSRRSSPQKLENREPPPETHPEKNKETESRCLKKKSATSIQADIPVKKSCNPKTKPECIENYEESASHLSSVKKNSSSDSSSVILKLLSKKPTSIKNIFCSESNQDRVALGETTREANRKTNKTQKESNLNVEDMEKSIVKSVWALTKVLLYEDGTKKLEVLEASLTPPEFSLNQSVKTSK